MGMVTVHVIDSCSGHVWGGPFVDVSVSLSGALWCCVVVVCVFIRGGRSWRSRWCRPSIVSCVFIRSPAGPSTSGSGQCGLLPLGDLSVSAPGRSAVAGLCVFVPNEPMDYNG